MKSALFASLVIASGIAFANTSATAPAANPVTTSKKVATAAQPAAATTATAEKKDEKTDACSAFKADKAKYDECLKTHKTK